VPATLVDSNVLLDVLTRDPQWSRWASETLVERAEHSTLVINPIIYAEVAAGFQRIEDLDAALPVSQFRRDDLPWAAGFLAGQCYLLYRGRGGAKQSPLPDFYIGAHAAITGMAILTRDAARYRTYFPGLHVIAP
jgi:predicted nucleic acid-binding protein